jgi:hypothetical protein
MKWMFVVGGGQCSQCLPQSYSSKSRGKAAYLKGVAATFSLQGMVAIYLHFQLHKVCPQLTFLSSQLTFLSSQLTFPSSQLTPGPLLARSL